jgi:hypothetical protein
MDFKKQIKENIINTTIKVDCTSNQFVQMTIKVDKANYGNYLYYDIRCHQPYKNNKCEHPFFKLNTVLYDDTNCIGFIGNVVADNELTRTLFRFLSMPDEELATHCGNTHQIYYRAHIIACISNLLD